MERIRRIHFVGIGGSGMGGIAEVLLNLGYEVSGSDIHENSVTHRLSSLGARIFSGHTATHIAGCHAVVYSSAVKTDNPELLAARAARIPVVPRAAMLAELMRFRYGIAVAGTHGKTTTTSLVASLLAEGELDPTFIIGGKLNSIGTHAKLGSGQYLVAEADESDASFLHLQPLMTVLTNIDNDHLVTYGGNFAQLKQTFLEFLHRLPFYGLAVVCIDDPEIRAILPEIERPTLTYGFSEEADLQAVAVQQSGTKTEFLVVRRYLSRFHTHLPETLGIHLNLAGRHNVLNALAALAIAQELGVSDQAIQQGFSRFAGINRRFQMNGEITTAKGSVLLVDDYAHHPREIAATFAAAQAAWPDRRIVVAFQPHRYTRTKDLMEEFASTLSSIDYLLLTEIYPAGEMPLPGISSQVLREKIVERGGSAPLWLGAIEDLAGTLTTLLEDGDVLLTLGAGDIGSVAIQLPTLLATS